MGGRNYIKQRSELCRFQYDHEITLSNQTVCRDGKSVRIVAHTKTRDLQVGCTFITRAALCRLLEISTGCDLGDEKVVQSGEC
jgi:hypothetical protein